MFFFIFSACFLRYFPRAKRRDYNGCESDSRRVCSFFGTRALGRIVVTMTRAIIARDCIAPLYFSQVKDDSFALRSLVFDTFEAVFSAALVLCTRKERNRPFHTLL